MLTSNLVVLEAVLRRPLEQAKDESDYGADAKGDARR